jgi:hypothetical protein
VRGHAGEPTHVAVLATLGATRAPRRGRRRRARPRPAAPQPEPAPVTTTRATLIAARPFDDERDAARWLDALDGEAEVERAVVVLNGLLHLQRTATGDDSVRGVRRAQALVARVGVGAGDEVADGRWSRAVEVPRPRRTERRGAALRPDERFAALLTGRDVALACEELTLRARSDLAAGRRREAALQLSIALSAALAELTPWAPRGDIAERLDELRELQPLAEAAAAAALEGGVDDQRTAGVERVLGRLEAALRARSVVGFD